MGIHHSVSHPQEPLPSDDNQSSSSGSNASFVTSPASFDDRGLFEASTPANRGSPARPAPSPASASPLTSSSPSSCEATASGQHGDSPSSSASDSQPRHPQPQTQHHHHQPHLHCPAIELLVDESAQPLGHDYDDDGSGDADWRLSPEATGSAASVGGAPDISRQASDAGKLMLSGGIAGALAKTATAPLSRLTILYQVQGLPCCSSPPNTSSAPHLRVPSARGPPSAAPPPMGMVRALCHLTRSEGLMSLWRGNLATVLHRVPFSATNFLVYEAAKHRLRPAAGTSHVMSRLLAGGTAGLLACTAAYPLDLLRTRLSAQTGPVGSLTCSGLLPTVSHIMRDEGALGLYRGLGATLAQVVPSLALNFTMYDTFKAMMLGEELSHQPSTAASLTCGCASGLFTSTLVFPLDVMRRNIQVRSHGASGQSSYWAVAQELVQRRGLRGLYCGILPEYCKVLPGMAIAFTAYEFFKSQLGVQGEAGQ